MDVALKAGRVSDPDTRSAMRVCEQVLDPAHLAGIGHSITQYSSALKSELVKYSLQNTHIEDEHGWVRDRPCKTRNLGVALNDAISQRCSACIHKSRPFLTLACQDRAFLMDGDFTDLTV